MSVVVLNNHKIPLFFKKINNNSKVKLHRKFRKKCSKIKAKFKAF